MATQVIKTTFKFKRGTANRWRELNPILRQGEPGFEYDTNKLKIGNGYTPYNELPYQTSPEYIVSRPTAATFPLVGEANIIYKAVEEKKLYQWNDSTKTYELLNSVDLSEIHGLISALQNSDSEIKQTILTLSDQVNAITDGAPENFRTLKEAYDYITNLNINTGSIDGVKIEGSALDIVDRFVEIPLANYVQAGLVKSANSVNKIQVDKDGTMEVHSLGISKLVQEDDTTIIFYSGDSDE